MHVSGCHHGDLLLKVDQFLQQARRIKRFINIVKTVQPLHTATVVAACAKLVKGGQKICLLLYVLTVFHQHEIGGGYSVISVKLFLRTLILDDFHDRRLRIDLDTILLELLQRLDVDVFYFNGNKVGRLAKIRDGIEVTDITGTKRASYLDTRSTGVRIKNIGVNVEIGASLDQHSAELSAAENA